MLIGTWGFAHYALGQTHHFDVGLLGKAFHVGDVTKTAREFKARFLGGEIGNTPSPSPQAQPLARCNSWGEARPRFSNWLSGCRGLVDEIGLLILVGKLREPKVACGRPSVFGFQIPVLLLARHL